MAPALALTSGDPSGVGPELTIEAWRRRDAAAVPPFYVLSDPDLLVRRARAAGLPAPAVRQVQPADADAVFGEALPVVPLDSRFSDSPGFPDPANAAGVI